MKREGKLFRNEYGRFQVKDFELTSGSLVEIQVGGHWAKGVIEFCQEAYYWFSRPEYIPVILRSGIMARIETRS